MKLMFFSISNSLPEGSLILNEYHQPSFLFFSNLEVISDKKSKINFILLIFEAC
jgi:hypothetical protein